ncbi:hypothetical protein [Candidatus Ichthyocystis sparus]|uniref:hypothetical protein n=1 Tax=Candidatus Ichthyocystis sparus TaxID=1561004 RepID=UPI000B836215|nr:hypothetical protein [Candidatus Ichthyocystis sparus]
MSDKRIYGTSGGSSSSETDGPGDDGRGSPLGAVDQGTDEAAKSEGTGGSGGGVSGRSLTAASGGLGSSQGLGARPKARDKGSKGGGGSKKGDDIWSNPTRKSARSLRGRGQAMAAARWSPHSHKQVKQPPRVAAVGPRRSHGPGSDSRTKKKDENSAGVVVFKGVLGAFLVSLLGMSVAAVLIYDLLTLERSDEHGKLTGLTRSQFTCVLPGALMGAFFVLVVFIGLLSSKNRKKSQREEE